jgi:hypothetical protein
MMTLFLHIGATLAEKIFKAERAWTNMNPENGT